MLPTQVLSGIYVSGLLPLPGSTHAHFTPSSISKPHSPSHFQCASPCVLSVPHMTGSLLQNDNPTVGTCLCPPGESFSWYLKQMFLSPRDLTSCLFPMLWHPGLLTGLIPALTHMLVPWCSQRSDAPSHSTDVLCDFVHVSLQFLFCCIGPLSLESQVSFCVF